MDATDSMFDRLGEMLSGVLESGVISEGSREDESEPHGFSSLNARTGEQHDQTAWNGHSNPGQDTEPAERHRIRIPKKKNTARTGEIIRGTHRQTETLPPEVENAFSLLHAVPEMTAGDIKRRYREELKKFHPDTGSTANSDGFARRRTDIIVNSYKILMDWYRMNS